MQSNVKKYNESYLYSKFTDIDKRIFGFLTTGEYVDRKDPSFKDISFDIKRRRAQAIVVDLLENSSKLELIIAKDSSLAMPRSLKVFHAKDVQVGSNNTKTFIDVTNIIERKNGAYRIIYGKIDELITYLYEALHSLLYNLDTNKIIGDSSILKSSTVAYAKCNTFILDHLRILDNVNNAKEIVKYMSAYFYNTNCMKRTSNVSEIQKISVMASGISANDMSYAEMFMEGNWNLNHYEFITTLSQVLKAPNLTHSVFFDKWSMLFGPSTCFAMEVYESFANMLIGAYCGAYVNNQKTIEKICGVEFAEFVERVQEIGRGVK